MSEASFQRTEVLRGPAQVAKPRPWPVGYGLLIGAAVSAGLWGAAIWGVARLLR